MRTINIYLTKEQKQKADKLRVKYRVSLSTLVGIVCFYLFKQLHEENHQINKQLEEEYINKKACIKTSVKPRELLTTLENEIKNKNTYATNCIAIYLDKLTKNYLTEKSQNKFYANVDKELNKRIDNFWNYNNIVRSQARAIRQNKEYYKKILEQ